MSKLREQKNEEKAAQVKTIKESKKAQEEIQRLLMITRSIVKIHLYPIKDGKLKGVIKDVGMEQEFSIDCGNITSRDLHEKIWGLIAKYHECN